MRGSWLNAAAGFLLTPLLFWCFASIVGLALDRDLESWARHDAAHELTRSIYGAVELYHRDHQRVPPAESGFTALVPAYVEKIPPDPWGRDLIYHSQRGDWADVISLGQDGKPGGYGLATDVSARYGSPGTSAPRSLNLVLLIILAIVPLAAFAASRAMPTSSALLAGIAFFWGWLIGVTIAPDAAPSFALLAAFSAVIAAIAGAVLSFTRHPNGPAVALAGTLACQATFASILGAIA